MWVTKIKVKRTATFMSPLTLRPAEGRGGGTPIWKGTGMLVVSLRGVNFGFWSRLGCSGQNVIIFSRQGLVKGCTRRNNKAERILNSLYLLNSYKQSFPYH